MFRFYSIGEPSDRVRRMFDVCKEALDEGYARVRPGMTSHDAAGIFESVIERRGFGEWMVDPASLQHRRLLPPGWGEDNVMAIHRNHDAVLEGEDVLSRVPVPLSGRYWMRRGKYAFGFDCRRN